jgi:hypothetical protein|uniref:Uncharacterized protein n=1 Tax=Desulfomonile tiedjei TaxID=2358 RepID=A0A7C4AQQ8_9BACT
MGITPIIRDDNGVPLPGRGSEIVTRRYTNVGQTPIDAAFSVDVKEVIIHIEGANVVAEIVGAVPGSEAVHWTADGVTLPPIRVAMQAHKTIVSIAVPSGSRNVSVLAWR